MKLGKKVWALVDKRGISAVSFFDFKNDALLAHFWCKEKNRYRICRVKLVEVRA